MITEFLEFVKCGNWGVLAPQTREYLEMTMYFFNGIEDPSDWRQLPAGQIVPSYAVSIATTMALSGVKDRRTDDNDNDFWVEHTELMG